MFFFLFFFFWHLHEEHKKHKKKAYDFFQGKENDTSYIALANPHSDVVTVPLTTPPYIHEAKYHYVKVGSLYKH